MRHAAERTRAMREGAQINRHLLEERACQGTALTQEMNTDYTCVVRIRVNMAAAALRPGYRTIFWASQERLATKLA